MFGIIGVQELIFLVALVVLVLPVWLWGRIARKAGFSKVWGVVAIIPVVNLVFLWVFAFGHWPHLVSLGEDRPDAKAQQLR